MNPLPLLLAAPQTPTVNFGDADFAVAIGVIFFILMVIVHVGFALFVLGDAREVDRDPMRRLFASPFLWTVGVLFAGLFGAVAYWAVHRSAISHDSPLNERA